MFIFIYGNITCVERKKKSTSPLLIKNDHRHHRPDERAEDRGGVALLLVESSRFPSAHSSGHPEELQRARPGGAQGRVRLPHGTSRNHLASLPGGVPQRVAHAHRRPEHRGRGEAGWRDRAVRWTDTADDGAAAAASSALRPGCPRNSARRSSVRVGLVRPGRGHRQR